MISVTELRAGAVFEDQGQIFQVISYEHIKMGRGSANIKVKVKNLKTGSIIEKSFMNGAKVKPAEIIKRDLQYLYKDADGAYFMNLSTFDQVSIDLSLIKIEQSFLKEGQNFSISFLNNEPLCINLPPKIVFAVEDTGPSLRGNSATNIYKDATLENGLKTKVPLFIKIGDKVRIDTKSGEYTEKAN